MSADKDARPSSFYRRTPPVSSISFFSRDRCWRSPVRPICAATFTRRGTLRRWQPRPLIELMRDPSRLEPSIVEELTALLPDRWHDAHPQFHLEINRKTRLVGDAA